MNETKIGFVGLGRMGANMARCLADRGYTIGAVYDVRDNISESLAAELGCAAAKSLPEVTAANDVIFTVVPDDAAMHALFNGENSLSHNAVGKIFINCATITPAAQEAAREAAEAAGGQALAAAMASSISQARQGTLYLMVGGKQETFDAVKPILTELSTSLKFVGTAAQAAQIKALVNMVMNINTAGLAEGLGLASALGLDLTIVKEVFSQTGANSRVLETDGDDMITREHECYFSAAHAAKDSGIANDLAHTAGIATPLSQATEAQYSRMIHLGLGELDKSGIAELTFPGRS